MTRDRIVAVGDLMFDVVVKMPGDLNLGSDLPSEISTTFGGTAGNVTAWIAHSGGKPEIVGVVGADHWGRLMMQHLASLGAELRVRAHPDLPTGVVVALVHPNGERSMLPDSRANAALGLADFADCDWQRTAWLYMSAYTLLNPATTDVAEQIMRTARANGARVALDPASAAPLAEAESDRLRGWLELADLLLPNELELQALTGNGAAETLLAFCPAVVVKRGGLGAEVFERGRQVARVPAAPAKLVDTVGAGDAFAGGLLAALVRGDDLAAAASFAVEVAARAVEVRGAQPERVEG